MDRACREIQNVMVGGNLDELIQLVSSRTCAQLSCAFAELKHRNIPLSDEIEHFTEYELIKGGYRNATYHATESNAAARNDALSVRAADMVKCIDLIEKHNQTGLYTDIDELLIQRLREVYAHVFFLKTHHRKLPLFQVQFCIGVFLKLVTGKPVNGFDIYAFTIDKVRLIRFLILIRNELKNPAPTLLTFEKYIHGVIQCLNSPSCQSLWRIPKRIRTFIRNDIRTDDTFPKIISTDPALHSDKLSTQLRLHYEKTIEWDRRRRSKSIFKELYDTYFTMKQHYSILKILTYIDGMQGSSIPGSPIMLRPMPSPSRIRAIKRTLQVIGEMIKSTRETPNITLKLNRVLQLITSDILMERTKDLRQFFSHGYSLSKWELERDDRDHPEKMASVFQKIEANLSEARRWFVYTQTQQNLRIYRQYLGHLRRFSSPEALRDYIRFIGTEFKASLIQPFLPEQLTEAKLLIEHLLRDFAEPTSGFSSGAVRDELEYILRDLELRVVAIRAENNSLGRSVDEFFFLETYARQPTARLDRVREIVDWILSRTELSNRHKLVQKTDLFHARELIARLQMAEQNENRRYLWGNVWERLAKESFTGIDALLGRTETRVNVALEETVRTLEALGLPLDQEEYVQFANRRLAKSYYPNVFVLDNKYRVLKEIIKDRRAQVNTRTAMEKLKERRKMDELVLQQMYDDLLNSMEELLARSEETPMRRLSSADQIALEYCLLEVAEILCNLGIFRDNTSDLATSLAPVITGRNLRNYLAHDFLAYDTLTNCTRTILLNAKYLVENRINLYNPAVSKMVTTGTFSEIVRDQFDFQGILKQQTNWVEQQMIFFRLVKYFHTSELYQLVEQAEKEDASANLLLLRRNFVDQDVVSIALDGNPGRFIEQILNYQADSDNFFHLLINFYKCEQLTQQLKKLIKHPHMFCFTVALKNGLMDVIRSVYQQSDKNLMQQMIDKDLSTIFTRLPTDFIRELMNLLPAEWFLGAGDHLGNTILHWTALRGDEKLLRFVLGRHRTLINIKNKFGDVPLLLALRYHGNVATQQLLDCGADLWLDVKIIRTIAMRDDRDVLGRLQSQCKRFFMAEPDEIMLNEPMRVALEGNHFEMFVMLHRSFRYSVKCGELLHLAARLDRVQFLKYILAVWEAEENSGSFIDSVNADYSFTPLMLALASGHYDNAQILLQHGANAFFKNENNYSPWHCAVHSGKKDMLSLLTPLEGLDVNLLTRDKRSALTIAIENGQSATQIVTLLRAGVIIRDDDVLRSCLLEKLDTLKLFINRRPELLSVKDFLLRSPLIIAVVMRSETMVQYLLDQGARIDDVNTLGMNSLHVAVLNNLTTICRTLLKANVNLNAKDNCGRTPLVIALENEHLGIAEMLLQCGATLESVYRFQYPLHRHASLLHKFTIENRPWMVQYLINKLDFPTDTVDEDGKTAAMCKNNSNE